MLGHHLSHSPRKQERKWRAERAYVHICYSAGECLRQPERVLQLRAHTKIRNLDLPSLIDSAWDET